MGLEQKTMSLVSEVVERLRRNRAFSLGFTVLLLIGVAYVSAGEGVVIPRPHDTLDYDVVAYVLFAEHPLESFYPELMGGMESSALKPTVIGPVVLYLLFPPVTAFSLNVAVAMLVAYIAMYRAVRYLDVRQWIAAALAFVYAMIPFQPTFGLTAMYMPLVVCATYQAVYRKRCIMPLLLVVIYGVFSSLAVGGFAVILALAIASLWGFIRYGKSAGGRLLLLLLALSVVYVFENMDLFASFFSDNAASLSHRVEFDVNAMAAPFTWDSISAFLFFGYYHAESSQLFLALFIGLFLAVVSARKVIFFKSRIMLKGQSETLFRIVLGCFALCIGIALFTAAFRSDVVTTFRNQLPGSLKSFQFDRVYFLYPTLWYIASACAFEFMVRFFAQRKKALLACMLVVLPLLLTLGYSARWSTQLQTIGVEKFGLDVESITWREYYAEDLFDEVEGYLREGGYGNPSDYEVASLGMYPAIALYNGFKAIDGYSNNYPLKYKYAFRSVIAKELALSDYETKLFDSWGNECVLVSHELNHAMNIPKDSGREVNESRLDIEAFKNLGGRFIFSAVRINNAEEIGLRELHSFSNASSYYEIWLYEAV